MRPSSRTVSIVLLMFFLLIFFRMIPDCKANYYWNSWKPIAAVQFNWDWEFTAYRPKSGPISERVTKSAGFSRLNLFSVQPSSRYFLGVFNEDCPSLNPTLEALSVLVPQLQVDQSLNEFHLGGTTDYSLWDVSSWPVEQVEQLTAVEIHFKGTNACEGPVHFPECSHCTNMVTRISSKN